MQRLAVLITAAVARVVPVAQGLMPRTVMTQLAIGMLAALVAVTAGHADSTFLAIAETHALRGALLPLAPVQFVRMIGGVPRPVGVAALVDGGLVATDSTTPVAKLFGAAGGDINLAGAARESPEPATAFFGVAVDAEGDVFISDPLRREVLIYRRGDHRPSPFAAPEWATSKPGALFARDGLLYVADLQQHRVVVVEIASEQRIALIGLGEGSGPGELRYPNGIWVAPDGVVFVADTNNDRIQRFAADGRVMSAWYGPFRNPRGLAGDGSGRIFVANTLAHEVLVLSSTGQVVGHIDRAGPREIGFPTGLSVAGDRLLVTDRDARGVFEFRLTEGRRTP